VSIQCKHPLLYSQWIEIMNDTSHRHLCMKYLAIGNSYNQWDRDAWARYEGRLLNGTMGKLVRKTTVRWIPISLEMYIRKILLVRKDWVIGRIPFARRKFRPTGYQGKGIGGRRNVSEYLEKSIVRISSQSTEERGIKTSQFSTGIEGNLLTTENKP